MSINVIMPALGMSQDTGKIIRWYKREGEAVVKGEPLLEIETEKTVVEIEAPESGILFFIKAIDGEDVPIANVIATILTAEEAILSEVKLHESTPEGKAALQPCLPESGSSKPVLATPLALRIARENQIDNNLVTPVGNRVDKADVLDYTEHRNVGERIKSSRKAASPKARKLAMEYGIDLAMIQGSGPDGSVLTDDVLAFQVQLDEKEKTKPTPTLVEIETLNKGDTTAVSGQEVEVSTVWRLMAERTTHVWMTVPHFYLIRDVDATQLNMWRSFLMERKGLHVTFTDLIIKATASALLKHRQMNARWDKDHITYLDQINIGIAVGTDDGLVVPVIQHVDKLNIREIVMAREELVMLSRQKQLQPSYLCGGSFTLSNLGMFGVDVFTAILNQTQAGILTVGRIADRVVPVNGTPAVQPRMTMSLTCDHRAIDGIRAAKFLSTLVDMIEEPLSLLE